jgi:hypothetical protein
MTNEDSEVSELIKLPASGQQVGQKIAYFKQKKGAKER